MCHDGISIILKLLQKSQANVHLEVASLKKKSAQVARLCDGVQNETPETVEVSTTDLDIKQSPKQDGLPAQPSSPASSSKVSHGAPPSLLSSANRVERLRESLDDCALAKAALRLQKDMHDKELTALQSALTILHEGDILNTFQELARVASADPNKEVMESISLFESLSQVAPHMQLVDGMAPSSFAQSRTAGVAIKDPVPHKSAATHEAVTIVDEAVSGCVQNIQREEGAKQDSDIEFLNLSSNIVAVKDNLAVLDSQLKAIDQSIAANTRWLSEQPARRHTEHEGFLKTYAAFDAAHKLVTKALFVLEAFYGFPVQGEGELHSKSTLLRGKLQGTQGKVGTILGIPTKYTKQDCSLVESSMKRLSSHIMTSAKGLESREHAAAAKYQRSENNAKMAQVADEKSRGQMQHSKSIIETQLVEYQRQKVQLAEDQRNIKLRLHQLHHDCDVISHGIEQGYTNHMDSEVGQESVHAGPSWYSGWVPVQAHHVHALHLMRWELVLMFSLFSVALLLLLFPVVSFIGALFQCSVIAFLLPRAEKSLQNSQVWFDSPADDHLG